MSYRILLVDPDVQSAASIEEVLIRAGYRAKSVGTFRAAIRHLTANIPDLMVIAARLGEFNGLHVVLRCRADNLDIPAVVAYERRDAGLSTDAAAVGARFFTKPIDDGTMLNVVSELLSGRSPRDPNGVREWAAPFSLDLLLGVPYAAMHSVEFRPVIESLN